LDLLSAADDNDIEPTRAAGGRQAMYPEASTLALAYYLVLPLKQYLSESILQAGLSTGKLHKGHFNASTYNYLQGSVSVHGYPKPVLLIGRENLNRAVHGDMVVIEVLDEAKWGVEGDEVVDQEGLLPCPIFHRY
jgi:exosome complex exonuclease DIS3/RRP44